MLSILSQMKLYVCQETVDIRKSFEGLSYLTKEVLKQDPLSGHLFIFFNRVRDKMKVLYWDKSGYAIWYKELQRGTFEKLSKEQISQAELMCLLEGIKIDKKPRKKRYSCEFSSAGNS